MITARPLRSLLATVIALPMFLSATPANAQFGGAAGIADAFRADFLARDMQLFVEQLRLEDWQRPIIEMLFEDYRTTFEGGVERVRSQIQDNQSRIVAARPEEVMEIILEPITEWDVERRALKAQFLGNVKAQLSNEQLKRWPRFERTLRRDKELTKGELDGESIDLYTTVRQMRMPYEIEETVDPLLVEYEIELDGALIARAAKIDSLQDQLKQAMTEMDYDAGLRAQDQIMAARIRVRAIQDAWIDRIADSLPGEYGSTLRDRALSEGYPRAFRPTVIPDYFERLKECPDLSNDQITELEAIELAYEIDMADLEMRIVEAIRQNQPDESRRRVERLIEQKRTGKRERATGPADDLLAKKKDLIEETRNRISGLLTPEQNADCLKGVRRSAKPSQTSTDAGRSANPKQKGGANSRSTNNFKKSKAGFGGAPPKIEPVKSSPANSGQSNPGNGATKQAGGKSSPDVKD